MSRATLTERVILHIDLDCFYCQVEQQRLNVPSTTPAVVQQHNALIAVNYPARAFGVKRMDKIDVAVKKCPSLVLMKVEMIDGKVSLERYREASSRIFEVFSEHGSCERASIDEAYMDVSSVIDERMPMFEDEIIPQSETHFAENILPDPLNEDDRRILLGSVVAEEIRNDVYHKLGYTCSIGIATNKLFAKIASAMNKPFQQTAVMPAAISFLLDKLPVGKVPNLGGKLGQEVQEKYRISAVAQLRDIPLDRLIRDFGEKSATFLFNISRGIDRSEVKNRENRMSLATFKRFKGFLTKLQDVELWLGRFAAELVARMEGERARGRVPKTMTLHHRKEFEKSVTRSSAMPNIHGKDAVKVITQAAIELYLKTSGLPCSFLGLVVGNMGPNTHSDSAMASINSFFSKMEHDIAFTPSSKIDAPLEKESQSHLHDEDQTLCKKCKSLIATKEWRQHQDYHYAMELQDLYTQEGNAALSKANSSLNSSLHSADSRESVEIIHPRKQQRSVKRKLDSGQSSIVSFFQKKT
eukprot:TRINITY_DN8466_c0_g1_i1.p1 TRINITY_DN8466_c0_g1~~TRINITY_DN8466_c0_g1_i1.p1  ORF type:complete len:526 (+),score=102.96 TRINITY_DN8466_c0_g1_i1:52-1629(+)